MESIQRKIVEVEDIADVIALMVNLNIETKGCKNPIEQMQDRICLEQPISSLYFRCIPVFRCINYFCIDFCYVPI